MALWTITIFRKIFVNKSGYGRPSCTPNVERSERLSARIGAEIVVVLIGIALLVCVFAADRQWLDRHFLPPFFASRSVYVVAASIIRIALAVLGVALVLFVRQRIGQFIARVPPGRLVGDVLRVELSVASPCGAT